MKLGDYKLVQVGNHSEFTTAESHRRFQEYLGAGGNVMIHGGDSFAVIVEYLPSLENPRYIWQRGHVWTHLSDQPSDFKGPMLLPSDAPANAPIVAPTAGKAIDYMNAFHTTVGYWIPGSKAVVANTSHPVVKGLNLDLGQEVPGPWGSEVDFAYEPQAWDILVRSDRAAPEDREFGIDAYDPTPLHRIAMASHKNLGLMMVCGENYPNIMANPGSTLFRELYRRSVRYLMDRGGNWRSRPDQVPAPQRDKTLIALPEPTEIRAVQYELPQFVNFDKQGWHLKAAPYAHYRVEASLDGQTWTTIADRSHGPWRGPQTDLFAPAKVRYLRFDGQFSNGEPFAVRNVSAR